MSLGLTIGQLAHFLEDDYAEGVAEIQRDLDEINRLLASNGLPAHIEPRTVPKLRSRSRLDHMGYSMFARLQRAVAYSRQTRRKFVPAQTMATPWQHTLVLAERELRRSHLICHSGAEGYYVPIDFPNPLFVEPKVLAGESVGSCQAAMRELILVAPLLNIPLENEQLADATAEELNDDWDGPLYDERQAWLVLFESFRLSIELGAVVSFH
jgi:hypothetical protein